MEILQKDREGTEVYQKTHCRYCDAPLPKPFLGLGILSLANSFLKKEALGEKEFTCPLRLSGCRTCGLVQLTHVVPPEKMFSNYLYVSSTTQTFRKHFSDYAKEAKKKFGKARGRIRAVDIGSNDGLLLACYEGEGMKAIGVEPAGNLSDLANQMGAGL